MGAESLWEPYTPVQPPGPPPPPPPPPPTPRRPRARRAVAVGCLALVLVVATGVGFAFVLSERLGNNVSRVQNAFGDLDEASRPAPTGALTLLLVGADSRSESTPPGVDLNGAN